MPVGYMQGTKRARSIPSLANHDQCGGVKKAGISRGFHTPRDKWHNPRGTNKSLHSEYLLCSDLPKRLKTMRPLGSGGVGRYPGAAAAVRQVSSLK